MSSNAVQTNVEVAREIELEKKMEQIDFSILLPEENVSNILSVNASVVVDKYEALLGELSVSGTACLNIVYLLEDGTVSNHKTCQDFSFKVEDLSFDPTSIIDILPNVIDIDIEKVNGNSFKVKLTIENTISLVRNQEINLLQNEDSDIYVKQSEIKLIKHNKRNCQTFTQNSVFETKLPVSRILNTSSVVSINKADALDGIVVFEGEITTRMLYVSEDDRPLLVSLINKDMFREEVEDDGATRESVVKGFATVLSSDIEENIDSENKTVEVLVPVKICYDLFEMQNATVTADAYSTNSDVELVTEAFVSTEFKGTENFITKIDGNITLDENSIRIDKVLAVDGAYFVAQSQNYDGDLLNIDGTINLNLIYLNDDEEKIDSAELQIPYSFKEKIGSFERVIASSQIAEIDATVKRGHDVYVDGKILTKVCMYDETETAVITEITKGEELAPRDGAIEIFFAEPGKTFWEIAKELRVDEELLKAQNSNVAEPFENPEKIVFFDGREISID